ncbi:hypothetical protein [Xanthomonas graminis]
MSLTQTKSETWVFFSIEKVPTILLSERRITASAVRSASGTVAA